jgi:hypothetical protein
MLTSFTLRITYQSTEAPYVPTLVEDLAHTLSKGQENVRVEWMEGNEVKFASLGVNGKQL